MMLPDDDGEVSAINGFILSRQWRDGRGKSRRANDALVLVYWLKTDHGALRVEYDNQKSVFFIAESDVARVTQILQQQLSPAESRAAHSDEPSLARWSLRPLELVTFDDVKVQGVYFQSQRDLYIARDSLQREGIGAYEADIRPTDRFLMERFVTGAMRVSGAVLEHKHHLSFHNPKVTPNNNYRPALTVMSLDIETSMVGERLFSIAAAVASYSPRVQQGSAASRISVRRVFMVGDSSADTDEFRFFRGEKQLLDAFFSWYRDIDPDTIIGWNVINFDLRFLQKTCDKLRRPLDLGRVREAVEWRQTREDSQHYSVIIPGRVVLDGIDTLKSATYNFESFSLEYVANTLLERGKLIHDVDNRGAEITRLFEQDKMSLARYNLEDCILVWEIFCYTKLIDFALERSSLTGLSLDRIGGSVAAFDNRYLPRLHRQGFVAPILPDEPVGLGSPGGFVMESQPGLYKNVLVLDFKSLYPSIIRTFRIDPLALVKAEFSGDAEPYRGDHEETENPSSPHLVPGFNGGVFDRRDSILPEIISELWTARDKAKQEKNAAMSQAVKILMNSFYGVLGTPGCRFFDARLPSSITLRGHQILNQTKVLVEERNFEVIYGDTDSIFVWIGDDETIDKSTSFALGRELAAGLNTWWSDHLRKNYGLDSYLEIEFETCFRQFVMPTIRGAEVGSKKRYAGRRMQEADDVEDDLIFKGLETVRTDWTALARDFQKELYRRIFFAEPYEDFIRQTVYDVCSGQRDASLVYRKRIRRRLDDYQRNVPPHVQAARIAERALQELGRPSRYARGGWIQYVMTRNGPEPLEYRSSALDYELYIERQILPIVDGIAHFLGTSFEEIAGPQLGLF